MDLSQWILIIISLSACIYASYTDLRSYRVSNACTFGLIFLGILSHLVRVLLGDQSTFTKLRRKPRPVGGDEFANPGWA